MAIKGIKIGSTTNKIDIAALESEGNAGKFIKAGSSGPVWDSPVTGTNDGTNWTSLSIQTASGLQEYAIPSGGGGTNLNKYTASVVIASLEGCIRLYNIVNNSKGNILLTYGNLPINTTAVGFNKNNYDLILTATQVLSNVLRFVQVTIKSTGATTIVTYEYTGSTWTTYSSTGYIPYKVIYYNDTEIQ